MSGLERRPLQGLRTVLRFNRRLYLTAVGAAGVLWWASTAVGDGPAGLTLGVLAALILGNTVVSTLATAYAYDATGLYDLGWLDPWMDGGGEAANIHAGFDESTELLRRRFPAYRWRVFDFFDPTRHTEHSIRLARAAHPPAADTVPIATDHVPLPDGSLDRVLLFLAAHEIRQSAERVAFLSELRRCLAPAGRILLVEHLRDLPNLLAYGPGAWHFHRRGTWLADIRAAGLQVRSERRCNAFINALELAADDPAD